jgi:mannobiose 2-epimerase
MLRPRRQNMPRTCLPARADRAWARSALKRLIERWLDFAPSENGFFRVDADRNWKRRGENTGTLVSQTRLVFVFARAIERGVFGSRGEPMVEKLEAAVASGVRFLLDKFRDKEHGGWFWTVDEAGELLEAKKDLYGHAFVILALAAASGHAAKALREEMDGAAAETIRLVMGEFRDGGGGFVRYRSRDLRRDLDEKRTQNPVMHLFEALCEAAGAEGLNAGTRDAARQAAEEVFGFVSQELYDKRRRCIPEYYDREWRPLSEDEGGRVDIGHQFEWSYLLRVSPMGQPGEAACIMEALLEFGIENGMNKKTGAVKSNANSADSEPIVWWVQCEAIRAASFAGRACSEAAGRILSFMREHFWDAECGGFYGSVTPEGRPVNTDKGSVWKAGYHETGMLLSLLSSHQRQGRGMLRPCTCSVVSADNWFLPKIGMCKQWSHPWFG